MELLADVTWENIVLVGTAMGIFGGGRFAIGKFFGSNGNGKFSQALCDQKHKHMGESLERIDKNVDKIFDHIDEIKGHLMK